MAVSIPTTTERAAANLARFEAKINQNSPLADKAFLIVLAALESTNDTGLYKYGVNAVKQNLALTATSDNLKFLGSEYGVEYKNAISAVLTATFPATLGGGATILTSNSILGDDNGVKYSIDASGTESGGQIDLSITSETPGTIGNLTGGDGLALRDNVAGVTSAGIVTGTTTLGTEDEDIEVYRQRVLSEIRTVGGGGNVADYTRWAELVEGVRRAFPYSGHPGGTGESNAGERTVWVEAQTSIEADGIAPQSLLDAVRVSITSDADTGVANQPLGMVDSTLYVESISRTTFNATIAGLDVDETQEQALKDDMKTELDRYFRSVVMYVDGRDVPAERNDLISTSTVIKRAQDVLESYNASMTSLTIDISAILATKYTLNQGELAKLGTVSYA